LLRTKNEGKFFVIAGGGGGETELFDVMRLGDLASLIGFCRAEVLIGGIRE